MPEYEVVHAKSPVFYERYERKAELQHQTHYCPGCGHGIAHKLIAEAVADMGLADRTIFVTPVGCSVFAYYYFDVGNVQAAHGRSPAVATGLKRACPESIVLCYQGDGDLAAIGTAEILHAANRGEKITVFFVNNAIYGMTGGQMAPTSLVDQKTTTTPFGRSVGNEGYPLRVSELLATLEAPVYIERVALMDNKNIMRARRAIRKAIQLQRDGAGFSLVEILSPCPTIWKLTPVEAQRFITEKMLPVFPPGVYRDRKPERTPEEHRPPLRPVAEVLELVPEAPSALRTGHAELEAVPGPDGFPYDNTDAPGWRRNLTIKIAGFGGQGVLLLGQILAEMGMREGLEVSWLPSYGPEMRSGSAHCDVCFSHEAIGSPLPSHPEALIAMNEISLRKFGPAVAPGGLILYNSAQAPADFSAPQAHLVCLPAAETADVLGFAKAANVVMLGALLAKTNCLPPETALEVLEKTVRDPVLLDVNRRALAAGANLAGANLASAA